MKKVYIIRETKKIHEIWDETIGAMLAAVRHRNPNAKCIIEDEELSQVHDLLVLVRLGFIKVSYGEDEEGRFIMFEIKTDAAQTVKKPRSVHY